MRAVQAAKMMVLDGDIVKYKQRLKIDPEPLNLKRSVKREPSPGQKEPRRKASPRKETSEREPAEARGDESTSRKVHRKRRRAKSQGGEQETEQVKEESEEKPPADAVVLREAKAEILSPESGSGSLEADYERSPSSLEEEEESRRRELEPSSRDASGSKGDERKPRSPRRPPTKRKEWTEEQRRQDNLEAWQKKKARKEAWRKENAQASHKGQGKGKQKTKDKGNKGKGKGGKWVYVKAVTFDGWADPPHLADLGIFQDEPEAAAEGEGSMVVPPQPVVAVDEPEPTPLNARSRVVDLQARLKQLGAPVWGDKARLWERVQEYEAHELSHLPYQPWCEACVRGRGKDLPHYGMHRGELDEARLRPMECMDLVRCSQFRRRWEKS